MKSVAIVGGGPAGSMAADVLARGAAAGLCSERHLSVTVFEARGGWEKPCGGGLTARALRRYPFLAGSSPGHSLIHEIELLAPSGASARFVLREPLVVYSRCALNSLLLSRAAAAGAKVVADRIVAVSRANGGWRLDGRNGSYDADYLVLAGGARDRLRTSLTADFGRQDFMLTLGYYVRGADGRLRVQFYENFEGYAWAFPRTEHASVGICARTGECSMADLRQRLHGFMERFGYARDPAAIYSHVLPSLSPGMWSDLRLSGPGWALVGDAAGLVDPVTGEGIYYAMRSGELLAQSILEGAPESYPQRVRDDFGWALSLGARLAEFFYRGTLAGDPITTRLIQLGARSAIFQELVRDVVCGTQSYASLFARVCLSLVASLAQLAVGSLRDAFREARFAQV